MIKVLSSISKVIWTCKNYYLSRKTPVVVFAPGRVGSMALHKNLLEAGVFAFKVEFYLKDTRGLSNFIQTFVFKRKQPAIIITIVRDPLTMMATYFFSKASAGHLSDAHRAWKNNDVESLQEIFIRDVLQTDRLDSHLYWFERDFKSATGINVYAYPFNKTSKFDYISNTTYPILLLRTEMDDTVKASAVSEFLHIKEFAITRENTRSHKEDAELYKAFNASLKIPTDILKKIYTAPVSQHFLTEEEIAAAITKYS